MRRYLLPFLFIASISMTASGEDFPDPGEKAEWIGCTVCKAVWENLIVPDGGQ